MSMRSHSGHGNTVLRLLALAAYLTTLALALYYAPSPSSVLARAKLMPLPERLTEVFFTDYQGIPVSIAAGQTVRIPFTIHNLEGATTTYPYRAYLRYPSGAELALASSTLTLADGAATTTTLAHRFGLAPQGAELFIEFPSIGDTLHVVLPRRP